MEYPQYKMGCCWGWQSNWDYDAAMKLNLRISIPDGEFLYTSELSGADGAHYHFWIPLNMPMPILRQMVDQAYHMFDVTHWSYDFLDFDWSDRNPPTRSLEECEDENS